MYEPINEFSETVLNSVPPKFVGQYDWLAEKISEALNPEYQSRFISFWAMGQARLGEEFYKTYFDTLMRSAEPRLNLEEVVRTLYDASANSIGRRSLPFSFATKLEHMRNRRLPIYDSQVAEFYFFQIPPAVLPVSERIERFMNFHRFLISEYRRIIDQGLLTRPIETFRDRFTPKCFTEERIIDSLIWAFVGLLHKDALWKKQIVYG
jgi:hypothetical protein